MRSIRLLVLPIAAAIACFCAVDADAASPLFVISGGIYNVSQSQILFAQYNSIQSKILNLTQMMALAFHGPASISYDAWERGMARVRSATLRV